MRTRVYWPSRRRNICTVQTLPWDMKAWHCGGYANNTHIGIEMCEDSMLDKHHLTLCLNEAADLFACLCITFKLDPTKMGLSYPIRKGMTWDGQAVTATRTIG